MVVEESGYNHFYGSMYDKNTALDFYLRNNMFKIDTVYTANILKTKSVHIRIFASNNLDRLSEYVAKSDDPDELNIVFK